MLNDTVNTRTATENQTRNDTVTSSATSQTVQSDPERLFAFCNVPPAPIRNILRTANDTPSTES